MNLVSKEDVSFETISVGDDKKANRPSAMSLDDTSSILKLLSNSSREFIILIDTEYRVLYINEYTKKQFKTLFNKTIDKGYNLLTIGAIENQSELKAICENALSGQICNRESAHTVDGEVLHLRAHFRPSTDSTGKITGVLITAEDITDFKKTQFLLEEAQLRWQYASEASNQGLWDWNIQSGYTYFSNSYKRLYGFQEEELSSNVEEWASRIHPDDKARVALLLDMHFKDAQAPFHTTYRIKDKQGKFRWIIARGVAVKRDEEGKPLRMVGTITDVTESKNTEANYRLLFYSNPLPMWTFDNETLQFVEVNDKAVTHYGYSREEFLTMTINAILPAEDQYDQGTFSEAKPDFQFQKSKIRHKKKDGTLIYVDITGHVVEQNYRKVTIITCQDITDKIKAEQQLLDSEVKYRTLFYNNPLPSWIYHPETHYFLEVNEAAIRHYGYTKEEFRQLKVSDMHPVDDRTVAEYSIKDAIEKDNNVSTWKHIKKNGETIFVEVSSTRIHYLDKVARLVVIHDKTAQSKAEKELRISNERFSLASKATSDAIWDWDLEKNSLLWGEGLTELFGYKGEDVSFEKWLSYVHPDDVERVDGSLITAIHNSDQLTWKSQYRFKASNDTYRYVLDRGFILRDEHQKPYRLIGSLQDITDLKIKEKELIKSNDRYKYVSLATSDIIWDWNFIKEAVLVSDNFNKTFGWDVPENNKISIKDCFYKIHPLQRDQVWRSFQRAVLNPESKHWESSFRYLKADGSYAFVTLKGYIIRKKNGESIRMIGAIQDVTDKKLKEKLLTESNERFDAVLKATNDLIWDWDLITGTFYRDEDGMQQVYGVHKKKDIEDINAWLSRIHPEDFTRVHTAIQDILHTNDQDTFEVEYRFRRDDNRYNFVYDRGIILRNKDSKPVRMIGAAQNVTERKRLEMQLLKKELDKQKLISQATIEAQEQERSEIGKELHDNVNQVLTTTKLYLDLSLSNVEMKDDLIEKSSKNIIYVINEIRQLSRSLMNPSLGDLGLIESITELIDNINLTGCLKATLKADTSLEESLSENQKLMIYRISQEALNNALKHANAQNVTIKLMDNRQWVEILIEDDGIGFNFDTIKKGSGLKHIQNRVYLANGTLNVISHLGKGCQLMINFPK